MREIVTRARCCQVIISYIIVIISNTVKTRKLQFNNI